jgi:hypothetical protein
MAGIAEAAFADELEKMAGLAISNMGLGALSGAVHSVNNAGNPVSSSLKRAGAGLLIDLGGNASDAGAKALLKNIPKKYKILAETANEGRQIGGQAGQMLGNVSSFFNNKNFGQEVIHGGLYGATAGSIVGAGVGGIKTMVASNKMKQAYKAMNPVQKAVYKIKNGNPLK